MFVKDVPVVYVKNTLPNVGVAPPTETLVTEHTFADHSLVVVAKSRLADAPETADRVATSSVGTDATHRDALVDVWRPRHTAQQR